MASTPPQSPDGAADLPDVRLDPIGPHTGFNVPSPVVVNWPEENPGMLAGARLHKVPRLVMIKPNTLPPTLPSDCLEEWIFEPITTLELANRAALLRGRTAQHHTGPHLAANGEVRFGGHTAVIDQRDVSVLDRLITEFELHVPESELLAAMAGTREQTPNALRSTITRLRKPLRPLGLQIQRIRHTGYCLKARTD